MSAASDNLKVRLPRLREALRTLESAVGFAIAHDQQRRRRERLHRDGCKGAQCLWSVRSLRVCRRHQDNGRHGCRPNGEDRGHAADTMRQYHDGGWCATNRSFKDVRPRSSFGHQPVLLWHSGSSLAQLFLPDGLPVMWTGVLPSRLDKEMSSDFCVYLGLDHARAYCTRRCRANGFADLTIRNCCQMQNELR